MVDTCTITPARPPNISRAQMSASESKERLSVIDALVLVLSNAIIHIYAFTIARVCCRVSVLAELRQRKDTNIIIRKSWEKTVARTAEDLGMLPHITQTR